MTAREQTGELIDIRMLKETIADNPGKSWLSVSLPVREVDPLAYIEQMNGEKDLYYWEQPDHSFVIASGGSCEILRATGKNRYSEISSQSRSLRNRTVQAGSFQHSLGTPLLMGGYSFSDHNVREEWKAFGAARFVLPEWSIIKTGKFHILTLTVPLRGESTDEILAAIDRHYSRFCQICEKTRQPAEKSARKPGRKQKLSPAPDGGIYSDWRKQIEAARKMIRGGNFQKIVIARKLVVKADQPIRITKALYHLRQHFPGCYIFMIRAGTGAVFMGATPERLVSLQKNRILTEGLAGSMSRGVSASEDATFEHLLMASSKERLEHDLVVRDIRKSLESYSDNVEYPREPHIKKLINVQHLCTPISARTNSDVTIHELAGKLHPTAAVGGYPREQAVPFINDIETIDRGWYAGPIGWFDLNGSGEFAVAIRSALINREKASLYAGCGIVAGSDPLREWTETEMKLKPLMNALKQAGR